MGDVWVDVRKMGRATEKAVPVQNLKEETVWLPKSQILDEDESANGRDWVRLELPEWLAIKKDLV